MSAVNDVSPQQQASSLTSTDQNNNSEPVTQLILLLEKKQRNLAKRKEKLESYKEKPEHELIKDQKEALAKYPEVITQIDFVKELNDQFRKMQAELTKIQKKATKQVAEEKRLLLNQHLCQYTQIRTLIDRRPSTLEHDETQVLDKLSIELNPSDNSPNSISHSVGTYLSIYQHGPPSIVKSLTGKSPQDVQSIFEKLIKDFEQQKLADTQIKQEETCHVEPLKTEEINHYSLQFDTRTQQIPLEQIIQNSQFLPTDSNDQIENNNQDQSSVDFSQPLTVVNSNFKDSSSAPAESQQQPEQTEAYRNYRTHGRRNNRRFIGNNYSRGRRRTGGVRYNNSYADDEWQYQSNNKGRGGPHPQNRGYSRPYYNQNRPYYNDRYKQSGHNQHAHSAPPSHQQ